MTGRTPAQEAERRYPDSWDRTSAQKQRTSLHRRHFVYGATWQARQPTDDARIEQARIAGAIEALEAVKGYSILVTRNTRDAGTEDPKYMAGISALSGRIQHMVVEAQSQLANDREALLLRYATADTGEGS